VTETSILRDIHGATLLLRELRDMGLRVAIDDFGVGFTSFAYLRDLPIDNLKIDRSFVRDVATGNFDGAVVRAVVGLARNLGLRTIAEGVEDYAQMDALRDLRCDAVQGFLFSVPLPAAECATLFHRTIPRVPHLPAVYSSRMLAPYTAAPVRRRPRTMHRSG
jgi:EAL domain-containing protein (putative c-di-GMP-specific phosphodiesterase class I)